MPIEDQLRRLQSQLDPQAEARSRVRARLMRRIEVPAALLEAKNAVEPTSYARARVWSRVSRSLAGAPSAALLDRIRELLTPPAGVSQTVWRRMVPQLHPIQVPVSSFGTQAIKWTAAFALIALVVRASPLLFLVPPTIAESEVTLLPTRGEVAVSIAGLWQPVSEELTLEPGMMLRTHEGQASILFHDDGVIRLSPGTTVTLHDTSDRREPAPEVLPVLTLHTGKIWLQGLVPSHVRGLTIATAHGHVTVHEGSVSIGEADGVNVEVYNRRATVMRGGEETILVRGERTQLWEGNVLLVKKITETEDTWVTQNLARDAVHRREIAQLQQERRAARARILPTSRLYPVKRVAERVDVLLTFTDQGRVEKQIEYAAVRLDEAAALLGEGKVEQVAQPLQEYRETLELAASGSGGNSIAQFLIHQAVTEATADVAASLPGDDSYLIKRAVLETSAALPDGPLSDQEVRAEILVDTLSAAADASEHGELTAEDALPSMQAAEELLSQEITPEVRKETQATLTRLAVALSDQAQTGTGSDADTSAMQTVSRFLPPRPASVVPPLTDEELAGIVESITERVYLFGMPQSRKNQLTFELTKIVGHPEEGRILRALYQVIPEESDLSDLIRKALVDLRWRKSQ